ncbi:hypothetical protein DB31_0605 [Hyalangium minutum]|uniref:Uncharacterized protein n=1 Tax=Hyalangium minutum TaxID=394096 RepID=A0A085WXD0_9BACT|nr:hypothetical protein DB31_0605 [Hyalangium minutum]
MSSRRGNGALRSHAGFLCGGSQDALEETLARLAGPSTTFLEGFAAPPE